MKQIKLWILATMLAISAIGCGSDNPSNSSSSCSGQKICLKSGSN